MTTEPENSQPHGDDRPPHLASPEVPEPPQRKQVALAAGWPSLKDFIGWTQDDPEGFAQWEAVARRVESGGRAGQSPEFDAALATFLAFRKQMRGLDITRARAKEIMEVAQAALVADPDGKLLARFKVLWGEMEDAMLDVPEPIRTQFFERMTPLRERIKAIGQQRKD